MASTRIYRTPSTTGTPTKFTYSVWFKRGNLGAYSLIGGAKTSDPSNYKCCLYFNSNDRIQFEQYGTGLHFNYQTVRRFRDNSAFYHLVVRYDSTDGTAGDRIRMYINGVEETAWQTESNPASSQVCYIGSTQDYFTDIGNSVDSGYFDGSMSHINFCDGQAYAASDFGETDSTSGIWKIKTSPSVTYGTNGFFLKGEDSSNLDLDSSGNNLSFTTAGILTATKDNPSNNFATLNPLFNSAGYFSSNTQTLVFANGNTYAGKVTHGFYNTTLAVSSGKFYWEVKIQDTNCMFGVTAIRPNGGVSYGYDDATCYAYYPYDDRLTFAGASQGTGSGDYDNTSDKIYMFAVDATNNKMWYGRDGTFIGSPSGGTGNTFTLSADHEWSPFFQPLSTAQNNNASFNFGNGYFATTAITSAGTNASGNGTFEYDVPTGFTALCTKGINS